MLGEVCLVKRPSFQFYPADWRNDAALQICSIEARGLWWEMLCLMHMAEPYGHLVAAGLPIDLPALSRIVGADLKTTRRLLGELKQHNVYSVTDDGIIYSRRMQRDEIERKAWRNRQARHRNVTPDVTPSVTPSVTPESRRSSSSSSSSSSKTLNPLSGSPENPANADPARLSENHEKKVSRLEQAKGVIDFLNEQTGSDFRKVDSNLTPVMALLKDGVQDWEVRAVIVRRCRAWKGTDMQQYLRPETLFNKKKFNSYLGEVPHEDHAE